MMNEPTGGTARAEHVAPSPEPTARIRDIEAIIDRHFYTGWSNDGPAVGRDEVNDLLEKIGNEVAALSGVQPPNQPTADIERIMALVDDYTDHFAECAGSPFMADVVVLKAKKNAIRAALSVHQVGAPEPAVVEPTAKAGFFDKNWQTKSCEVSGLKCWSWISYFKNDAARVAAELERCEERIHNQRIEIKRLAALDAVTGSEGKS